MKSNLFTIAKFEFIETIRKPSFWLATLFMPILIGVISYITGYANVEASKKLENETGQFEKFLILDEVNVIDEKLIVDPLYKVTDYKKSIKEVKNDSKKVLINIPRDFFQKFEYEIFYKKEGDILGGVSTPSVINSLIKQSALLKVTDPTQLQLLTSQPKSKIMTYDKNGVLEEENFGQYIVPIASLAIFFISVFISSGFLLQSVSAEKENRMIETMLSIVDKKSLVFGKMIGLIGVVLLQMILWLGLSGGLFLLAKGSYDIKLPFEISQIDFSTVPINIFLIFSGFIFFSAIMIGVGAIGTGAQDSKNLSSIFILMAIFPMYLMQILIMDPFGKISTFFTYFPFTSYMILLLRNSLSAISSTELIIGLIVTTFYNVIALWLALKLFELGCLMYNRRPSIKEILSYIKR